MPATAKARASHKAWKCQGTLEQELRSRGYSRIAGADEVGRGSLFGAVVAGAVILSPDAPVRGLNDSKQIEPERREVLAERIRERAVAWSVAAVDALTIDRMVSYSPAPRNGRRPVKQRYSMTPIAYWSLERLALRAPRICSGAM